MKYTKLISTHFRNILFQSFIFIIIGFQISSCKNESKTSSQEIKSFKNSASLTNANWQLFIDDYWIAESKNITSSLHQPKKHPNNPLIKGDVSWEEAPYCFGTAIYDEEESIFKLWYQSYNYSQPVATRTPILYATSKDGIKWERPNLGLYEFQESKNNNIIMQNYGYHDLYSPSVIKDTLEINPQKRYKMIWWDFPLGDEGYQDDGMCVAFSPDGIHWNKYQDNPVLHASKTEQSISDVMAIMQDQNTGKYVAYTKGWAKPWPSHRQIVRVESDDFINWSEPEVVIRHANDSIDPQSYGMTTSQFGNNYIGLLHSYKKPGNETIDIQLTTSHDNKNWVRVANQETFISVGAEGTWDDGMLFTTPPINHGDKTLIYYSAWDGAHNTKDRKSGIGLASLRKNGFVSLDATDQGYITTHYIKNTSEYLLVNVNATGGSMRAELLDESSKPISGYTLNECISIQSDEISGLVQWKNHSKLPKQTFQIRFQLENASLYCFYAGHNAERLSNDFTNELSENADIETIANHLIKLRKEGGHTRALALHYSALNKEKAYEIQMEMLSQLVNQGERLVGWKMGGANLDNFNPSYGFMLSSDKHASNEIINQKKFAKGSPLIEAEIGFVLKKDLPGPVTTKEELMDAIESVGGYCELINIRTRDSKGGIKATSAHFVADGMSHGGFIFPSKKLNLKAVELNNVTAKVLINGKLMAKGNSQNFAFLDAILYLANSLPKHGRYLRSGDIIMTGSILTPPPANKGDQVEINFSTFESLKIEF